MALLCKLRRSSEEEEEEVAVEFGARESVRTERFFIVFFVDMVWDMRKFNPLDFGNGRVRLDVDRWGRFLGCYFFIFSIFLLIFLV